jgi:NitT/TauT family transport system substrate-binding protein
MVAYVRGIRAMHDALREGGAKKDELVRFMIKHTPLKDPEIYRDVEWGYVNPDGAVYTQSVAAQQEFFVKNGRVEKPVPIEKVVDNSFAEHAVKVLGTYRR